MKRVNTNRWSYAVVLTVMGISAFSGAVNALAAPAPAKTYQVGDQVEVQWPGDDKWYAAKITDKKDGRYFIVYDQDGNNAWYNPDRIRLVKSAAPAEAPDGDEDAPDAEKEKPAPKTAPAKPDAGDTDTKVTQDADGTLSADRPILIGPVKQKPVKNGARPDAELLKKIIRYHKGEKPAQKGYDGAVTVDVTALQIGQPRKWSDRQDTGSGTPGTTVVYPVKATYTVKTFYRTRTVINADWVRILNCYVNAFGEWQIGSEEPVKSPDTKDVPRKRQ